MRNPLQEQLLKAGLAKKSKVAEVVREQAKQRHAKRPSPTDAEKVDARQLQAERAERDRALAAERNAQARVREARAQIRQIVESGRVEQAGDIDYGFDDAGRIKRIPVDAAQRALLASGALVIARHDAGYALLPRAAAEKVYARDAGMIVLDHGRNPGSVAAAADDASYENFPVPDDLIW